MKKKTNMEHPQGESIMRFYQALESASQEMLEAARDGDWDRVSRIESNCAEVIASMGQLKQAQPLSPQEQPERLRILRSILANDAQILRIAQPLPAYLDSVPKVQAQASDSPDCDRRPRFLMHTSGSPMA